MDRQTRNIPYLPMSSSTEALTTPRLRERGEALNGVAGTKAEAKPREARRPVGREGEVVMLVGHWDGVSVEGGGGGERHAWKKGQERTPFMVRIATAGAPSDGIQLDNKSSTLTESSDLHL